VEKTATPFVPLRRNEISQREEEERNTAEKIKVFFSPKNEEK